MHLVQWKTCQRHLMHERCRLFNKWGKSTCPKWFQTFHHLRHTLRLKQRENESMHRQCQASSSQNQRDRVPSVTITKRIFNKTSAVYPCLTCHFAVSWVHFGSFYSDLAEPFKTEGLAISVWKGFWGFVVRKLKVPLEAKHAYPM